MKSGPDIGKPGKVKILLKMIKISNLPPKGTADWFPAEYKIREYIFTTWRTICKRYGYEEYLTPIMELADLYRAKSGEDVGGKELMSFFDRGGRELSIRPEMTPSVTRMVSRIYNQVPKPLRLFSIANFVRNEKPQRGRNREFWQLNFDIFGASNINADLEILQVALDIMIYFITNFKISSDLRAAADKSFKLYINDRKLLDYVLQNILKLNPEIITPVVRLLDKYSKLPLEKFKEELNKLDINTKQYELLTRFLNSQNVSELAINLPELAETEGYIRVSKLILRLEELGYSNYIEFKPTIIRGFDYYDGMIFEVYDTNEENNRAMFGGGRYNGLASLFGNNEFPAVGCAPGDETTKLFLESWQLLDFLKTSQLNYYCPLLNSSPLILDLVRRLRAEGFSIELGLEEQNLTKALNYANNKSIHYLIILGEEEEGKGIYKIKNMQTRKEEVYEFSTLKKILPNQ